MKNFFLLVLASCLLLSGTAFGLTIENKLNDAMGQAYKAATEKKIAESKDWFEKAGKYAEEAKDWQGLLDAGYGLSTLGDAKSAKNLFDKAKSLIESSNDWHSAVALGYAYASLPNKLKTIPLATKMWELAQSSAEKEQDAFGLIEAGRGFLSINETKNAEKCLDLADPIVKQAPTQEAVKTLAEAYRKLGKNSKAAQCESYLTVTQAGPPPGWQPSAGETVRGPKTISPQIQQAQRASADQEIAAQENWEQERARQKQEEQMQKQQLAYQAYSDYLNYYSYPYYGVYGGFITNSDDYYGFTWGTRPIWAERTYPEISNWAFWNLGRYTYDNDRYYRHRGNRDRHHGGHHNKHHNKH